jgi:hypothetical protein
MTTRDPLLELYLQGLTALVTFDDNGWPTCPLTVALAMVDVGAQLRQAARAHDTVAQLLVRRATLAFDNMAGHDDRPRRSGRRPPSRASVRRCPAPTCWPS